MSSKQDNARESIELSLVIPVYNEQEAIEQTIQEARRALKETDMSTELILVDDGSTDATKDILSRVQSPASVVTHPRNAGYGASLKSGVRHARGKWVAIADADGTYPFEQLPKLCELLSDADMVVGARPNASHAMVRRPAKWLIGKLANFVAQMAIPDLNSGFRVFRRDLFNKYPTMLPDGFSLTTTLTLAMHSDGYRVVYTPISYHPRKGKSKIHPLKDPLNFILLILRICLYFNPLRVFGPLSIVFFCLGTLILLYSKFYTPQIMDITVTVAYLVAVQMLVLGLLGDLFVRRNRG